MAGYIGTKAAVVTPGAERKKVFSITTTTTSLTGLAYTPGFVHVFHNGVRLVDGTDYTATNGTSLTLTTAAQNGDEVVVISYATFQTSDTVSASAGGTFSNAVTVNGNLTVDTDTLFVDAANNRVGIGTSSPTAGLTTADGFMSFVSADANGYARFTATEASAQLGLFRSGSSAGGGYLGANSGASFIAYDGSFAERMRITSGGVLLVGQTTNALADTGHILDPAGLAYHIAAGNPGVNVNRKADDGNLVTFYQDGSLEGTISVSGSTVSYNGGHLARWSQTADNTRIDLLKGTVMTNLDQMAVWGDEDNEQLNCMAVSSVEGDPNVAGVFVNWDNDDDEHTNDMNIAMTGDMIIRIAQGTTVQRGDLLMSAGDGTAKPQGDDIIRSKTIAKVTSTHVTCTYEDNSYCVPCVLMAC
jgi:hypothetical protein